MVNKSVDRRDQASERGFVLVSSLVMLTLLTVMTVAMFYVGRSSIQTSSSAQSSAESYYYAETAVNYITWALHNDAELDSFEYTAGAPQFADLSSANGDLLELKRDNSFNPGPTGVAGAGASDTQNTTYTAGQILYFDNSPMGSRKICFQDATLFANCIDVTVDSSLRVAPAIAQIIDELPRYIKLEIAEDGTIIPSIPALPHPATPVVGVDVPENGAIAWLTAGDVNDENIDIELFPLVAGGANGGISPFSCLSGQMPTPGTTLTGSHCPCDGSLDLNAISAHACNAHATGNAYTTAGTGAWVTNYSVVVYAIGYVNGKPTQMIRSVAM